MTDIIIGARNPRPQRLRKLVVTGGGVVVVYVLVRWLFGSLVSYPNPDIEVGVAPTLTPDQTGNRLTRGDDTLSRRGELRVFRGSGSVGELGVSAGWLFGADADAAVRAHSLASVGGDRAGLFVRLLGGRSGDWQLRHVDDGIPGHQLVEIAGFARGLRRAGGGASYTDVVRAQASVDVGAPDRATAGHELRAITRAITVVAPINAGGAERLVLVRSVGFPGLIDGGDAASSARAVKLMRPDGVLGFASVGDAASLGVLTGINAEGLVVAVHPLRTAESASSDTAQPVSLLARDILENARSLEQAVAILEAANPLGSAIFVLVDGTGREAVVVERTPQTFGVRADEPPLIVVDLLESAELADDPESERNRRRRPDAEREARAKQILDKRPAAAVGDLVALLRDRKDVDGVERVIGHRGVIADARATHAAVIDPAAMVLWAADGPGVAGPFRAFDLRHELRGEGKRPAPPPDIAGLDPGEVLSSQRVTEAASLLRRARAARDRARARELIGRALLVAPDLPEALLLAAELAEDRAPYIERLREVGVDIPGLRERFE